jgi:predicted RecB family nuclease
MWSLHKLDNKEENLSYYNFYDFSGNDPRRDFIIKLIDNLGNSGDILIYSDYEKRILNKIIESYPELKNDIENIISRCVDMLKLVKENYYHPGFKGSFSLKSVSRILPEGDIYNSEYVNSGDDASRVLMQLITGNIDKELIPIYKQELLKYAEKDTLSLVNLYNHLISVA